MTPSLYSTIQRIVQNELGRVRTAEIAVVQEQHPHAGEGDKDNYACTVKLRGTDIVLKQVPVATQRIGTVSIPAVGEMVIVQFVGGDINAPVITGRLYNDEDRPPVNDDNQSITHLPLGASESDAVHLELLSGDQREIVIKLGKGISINIRDDDPVIELKVDGGKATVQIDRDGAIKVESKGDLQMKANQIKLEAQGQFSLEGGTVKIKGNTVNIN